MNIHRYINAGAVFAEDFRSENQQYSYTNAEMQNSSYGLRLYFSNGSFTIPETQFVSYMYHFNGDTYAYDGTNSYKNGSLGSEVIAITTTGFSGVTGVVSDLVFFDRVLTNQEILDFYYNRTFDYGRILFGSYYVGGAKFDTMTELDAVLISNNKKSDGVTDLGLTEIQLADFNKRYIDLLQEYDGLVPVEVLMNNILEGTDGSEIFALEGTMWRMPGS